MKLVDKVTVLPVITVKTACENYVNRLRESGDEKNADDIAGRFKRWIYDDKISNNALPKLTRKAVEAALAQEQEPTTGNILMDSYKAMQAKKLTAQPEQCQCQNCKVTLHASDCAVHSGPAYPAGGCDCGAQPEQEPVFCEYCGGNDESPPNHCMDCARPQRTWVGLTDEDLAVCGDEDDVMLARYWERVCKEKNNG